MLESDTIKFIREEIKKQVNIILSGQSGNNTVHAEDIQNLFPGMPTINDRPIMHPYGYASRAPEGTIQVTARQGEHAGNRIVLGHRDKDRPEDLKQGESATYSEGGMQSRMGNDQATIGKSSDGSAEGFAGNSFVKITDQAGNESLVMMHKLGSQIQIDKNGSVIMASKDGNIVYLNAQTGEVTVASKDGHVIGMNTDGITIADKTGKQIISLEDGKIQVTAETAIVVQAPEVSLSGGNINLGSTAAFSNVIAEQLEVYLTLVSTAMTALGHPEVVPPLTYNANPALSWKSLYVKQRSNIV